MEAERKIKRLERGRPAFVIDLEMVERMAARACTHIEIAQVMKVSRTLLTRYKGFQDAYQRGFCMGNQSLRRKQYEVAMGGNVPMLVWLGKQRLGQKDTLSAEISGDVAIHDG